MIFFQSFFGPRLKKETFLDLSSLAGTASEKPFFSSYFFRLSKEVD
jgi:hypothetical protein